MNMADSSFNNSRQRCVSKVTETFFSLTLQGDWEPLWTTHVLYIWAAIPYVTCRY